VRSLRRCRASQLKTAVSIVGAQVMQHNVYLHSALVQLRKIDSGNAGATKEAILYHAIEGAFSLAAAVLINLFVVSVFATGFHGTPAADSVGLSTAGKCAPRGQVRSPLAPAAACPLRGWALCATAVLCAPVCTPRERVRRVAASACRCRTHHGASSMT
jgi:Mn2+/Fe2+ NRAMP family transporter